MCALICFSSIHCWDNTSAHWNVLLCFHHGAVIEGVLSAPNEAKQDILVLAWQAEYR
jgi:hypothetical protein